MATNCIWSHPKDITILTLIKSLHWPGVWFFQNQQRHLNRCVQYVEVVNKRRWSTLQIHIVKTTCSVLTSNLTNFHLLTLKVLNFWKVTSYCTLETLMVGHGGSSAGSYLANPTSPIPSHCASIVVTSTVRVNMRLCSYETTPNYISIHFNIIYCIFHGTASVLLYVYVMHCRYTNL